MDEFLVWDPVELQQWFIHGTCCNIYCPFSCQELKEGSLVACCHSTWDLKELNYVACFPEFLSSLTTSGIKMVDSPAYLLEGTAVGLTRQQEYRPTNKPRSTAEERQCETVWSADGSCISAMLSGEKSRELLAIGRA